MLARLQVLMPYLT